MAEQYIPHMEIYPAQTSSDTKHGQERSEHSLISVDFRPELSREEIMHRIGRAVTHWWLTDEGRGAISHEPMNITEKPDGSIHVRFKQYTSGISNDEFGIIHPDGWTGTETIHVLDIGWDAYAYTVTSQYAHPRNFRYILPQYEARRRTHSGNEEILAIGHDLWNR